MYQRHLSLNQLALKPAAYYKDTVHRWVALLIWIYSRGTPKLFHARLTVDTSDPACPYLFSVEACFREDRLGRSRGYYIANKIGAGIRTTPLVERIKKGATAKSVGKDVAAMLDAFSDEELAFICQTQLAAIDSSFGYDIDKAGIHADPFQDEFDVKEVWEALRTKFQVAPGIWDL